MERNPNNFVVYYNDQMIHTLKIRYEFAHRYTENEILQNLSKKCKRHAKDAEQQIRNCLEINERFHIKHCKLSQKLIESEKKINCNALSNVINSFCSLMRIYLYLLDQREINTDVPRLNKTIGSQISGLTPSWSDEVE